jgi:hypothetical protein
MCPPSSTSSGRRGGELPTASTGRRGGELARRGGSRPLRGTSPSDGGSGERDYMDAATVGCYGEVPSVGGEGEGATTGGEGAAARGRGIPWAAGRTGGWDLCG